MVRSYTLKSSYIANLETQGPEAEGPPRPKECLSNLDTNDQVVYVTDLEFNYGCDFQEKLCFDP